VERRRRLRGGRRRGISRPWISPFPRKPVRAPSPAKFLARELRLGLAANERNPSAFRQSQGREGEMAGWGLVSNTLKWPSWAWPVVRSPYQTRPICFFISFSTLPPRGKHGWQVVAARILPRGEA
jgi:hypothetical protein